MKCPYPHPKLREPPHTSKGLSVANFVSKVKKNISVVTQYASGSRRGRSGRKRSRLRAHVPSTGRQLRRISQKKTFQFIMAAGEEVSLYLPWSSSIDLYLNDHFLPGETFLLLASEP